MGRIENGKEKDFDGLLCLLKSALNAFHEVDFFLCRNDVSEMHLCKARIPHSTGIGWNTVLKFHS